MVFESLINPQKAERHPWEMFFYGLLYASLAMALSIWIFKDYAGLISVFFTVMACLPLIYNTLRLEEEKVDYISEERSILKEHSRALMFFVYLFLGMTFAFALWYVAMPAEVSRSIFSVQMNTILDINSNAVSSIDTLSTIFFNNIKVMTFSLLFSFFFGAGSIFILTWNASIIAVAMGSLIDTYLSVSKSNILLAHIGGFSSATLRYLIHGVPEISAYFVAALAGGIISVAIVNKDIFTKDFQKIAFDTSNLIMIAVTMLLIASILETYVTPFFY